MWSRSRLPQKILRSYSTNSVRLSFDKYLTQTPSKQPPVLICHGLFGSKQNWKSLAKTISRRSARDVYALDMRNHGESPHCDVHTYDAMAEDLVAFMKEHQLDKPVLLGHSMGGKVVMTTAMRHPALLSKLVVVDIAPVPMRLAHDHQMYVEGMRAVNSEAPSKQKEADKILQTYEPDLLIRQFLLTNLKRQQDGIYRFRVPYEILGRSLGALGEFLPDPLHYNGPTLFITGGESPYRKPFLEYPDIVQSQFPCSRIENIEGVGHWVQTENPTMFLDLVVNFLTTTDKSNID
ncbi:hypothetical protein DFQ28_011677 [Apophysomyces sp. BC1034]|nr:hypothetical protein DFQ30_000138 [Apophysomyces sp. BC1015]KAG0168632.1 hypothetical protein DFQ29_010068 [Apophysomyces sp. BC1021]KAG0184155.1 hypothetical protein DFQ28_011677 [Apophysomyces sp. BC1034]